MPSITLERSTTADRAQHAAAASSPSVPFPTFESDSEEDTSSSSAAAPKRGRSGKAPLRAAPPAPLFARKRANSPTAAKLGANTPKK